MSTNCLYLTYQGKYEKHIDKNKEIAESKSMQTTFYLVTTLPLLFKDIILSHGNKVS